MGLKCGIVGLPNVGKSTLFSILSKQKVLVANYPFATIDPNVGVVNVPDKRLQQLTQCVHPKRIVPAIVNFVDIAGLVKGASQGEGLGNQFLSHIRSVDALLHVIRCFEDDAIVHTAGSVDPLFDHEVINEELRQADIALLQKRAQKLVKQLRSGDKEAPYENQLLQRVLTHLQQGDDVRHIETTEREAAQISQWPLLTTKPVIYVANVDEATLQGNPNLHLQRLATQVDKEKTALLPLCLTLEAQVNELPEAERETFRTMCDMPADSIDTLIKTSWQLLELITYFTAGPEEVRAWTIQQGTQAPQAAGVIHSDFEQGFIKAEVIKLKDYVHYGSEEACRKAGKITVEGKKYVVKDGDIIHFRYQV